jgi:hypothetical protein
MSQSNHSLGQQLVQEVQKQAAMKRPLPMNAEAQSTLPSGASVEANVVLNDNDRFSHIAEKIQVKSQKANGKSPQAIAEKFCERVTYLPERLQFVESDAKGNAIARSSPATMRGKGSEYFEAKIGEDEISLQRFKPNAQKPGRASTPFHVTDETLERLADDAAGVLAASVARK